MLFNIYIYWTTYKIVCFQYNSGVFTFELLLFPPSLPFDALRKEWCKCHKIIFLSFSLSFFPFILSFFLSFFSLSFSLSLSFFSSPLYISPLSLSPLSLPLAFYFFISLHFLNRRHFVSPCDNSRLIGFIQATFCKSVRRLSRNKESENADLLFSTYCYPLYFLAG